MEEILQLVEEARRSQQTILNLSHRGLKIIPSQISKLFSLHTLLLNNNDIVMPPEEISHLKSLEYLSLENNQLTLLPSVFSSLQGNLRFLNVSDNPLTHLSPVVCQLTCLRFLWLDRIGLTSFPSELCCLLNLQTLSLAGNDISEVSEEIGNLVNLKWLSLAKNKLSKLGKKNSGDCAHFTKLVKLEILILQDNLLVEFPLELCTLAKLTTVNLRRNKIFSLPSETVGRIMRSTTLVKLDFRENPFNLQLESVCKDYKPYSAMDDPRIILT